MGRALTSLLVVAAVAASLGAALPAGGARKPRCTGTGELSQRGTLLAYRLRCSFEMDRLDLRSSAPLVRVGSARADGRRGRLRCRRRSRSLMRCGGEVSAGARVTQAIRIRRRPCEAAKFRLRAAGPVVDTYVVVLRRRPGC